MKLPTNIHSLSEKNLKGFRSEVIGQGRWDSVYWNFVNVPSR